MKRFLRFFLLFTLSFVFLAAIGCHFEKGTICFAGKGISPEGEMKKVKKDFKDFSEISISSGFKLELKLGTEESVEIEAQENLHQYIKAEQSGDNLYFGIIDNHHFNNDAKVIIHVTAKEISSLSGSGGAEIKGIGAIKSGNLALALSGGSWFKSEVDCRTFAIALSGGSTVKASGKCENLEFSASGGSIMKSYDLETENLDASLSGGSKLILKVNGSLKVDASGGSEVEYTGNGIVKSFDLSGGSEVNKK